MTSSRVNAIVLKTSSELALFALNAQEIQPSIPLLKHANAHQDTALTQLVTVSLDVELMRFSRMENAVASQDSTQSKEFVEFVHGTKFMTKASDYAEFPADTREFSISRPKPVSVSPNTSKWLMELVIPALPTQLTIKKPNLVFVILDISRTSVSAPQPATLTKSTRMESVSADKVTT